MRHDAVLTTAARLALAVALSVSSFGLSTLCAPATAQAQAPEGQPLPQPAPPSQPQPAAPQPQPYAPPQPAAPQPQPYAPPQPAAPQPQPYAPPQPAAPQPAPPQPYAQPQPYPAQPYPGQAVGEQGGIPPLAADPPDVRGRARDPRPLRLEWRPGEVVPPSYVPDSRPDVGMMIGGLVTFGVPYLSSSVLAYVATVGEDPEYAPLFVPVVGPLIAMGTLESEGVGTYFLALDAITQAVGASLFVASLLREDTYLRRVGAGERGVEVDLVAGPAGGGLRARF